MNASEPRSFAPKIELQCLDDVTYWSERLGASPSELAETVERVGANPKAVATELGVALLD